MMLPTSNVDTARQPVGEVLAGLDIAPLNDGEKAVEAFLLIKVDTGTGGTGWSYRSTTPNREELLGALMVQVEILRHELLAGGARDDG